MVVTGKLKAVPTLAVYEPALVMTGTWSMVSVKCWVTVPVSLVAVMASANTPVPEGVPAMVAVPLVEPNVIPAGSVPVSVTSGAG